LARHESWEIFTAELSYLAVQAEERHREGFFYYFGELANFAPWSLVAIAGLPWMFRELRTNKTSGLKLMLTWFLATFVLLMAAKNKQRHYLIVLLPACAMLAGWALDRLAAWRSRVLPAVVALAVALAAGNIYECAFHDPARSNEVKLREFLRRAAEHLRPEEELVLVRTGPTVQPAHYRSIIALAFYTQRLYTSLDESAVPERIRSGKPLAVITTGGPLPAPLREVASAPAGQSRWSLWKRP
jgi:hypothetical protein